MNTNQIHVFFSANPLFSVLNKHGQTFIPLKLILKFLYLENKFT
jgi:hypothetical protein